MNDCQHCEQNAGVYDFDRDCCVTRWIMDSPDKQIRVGKLEYLYSKIGEERTLIVKKAVEESFSERCKQALSYAHPSRACAHLSITKGITDAKPET